MLHEDERLIEIYASEPEVLSTEDRIRVEELVHHDHEAAEMYSFFKSYYEDLRSISNRSAPEVAVFVERLFPSQRITYLHGTENALSEIASGNLFLEELDTESGFHKKDFAAFVSDEENVLLIIQYADDMVGGSLHLVTDLPGRQAYALVHCPVFQFLVITNELGRAEVPIIRPPTTKNLSGVEVAVRFPLASFELNEDELIPGIKQQLLPSGISVLLRIKEKQIDILVESERKEEILFAGLIDERCRYVSELTNHSAHFPIESPPRERILIKLY